MLYDHTWHFEWTTQRTGFFQKEESGWVLQGRPHAFPDTGWIVAHDVFHHLPVDRGTYSEEVTTFGAEAWLDQADDPERLQSSLATSWFSVMALTIEHGTRGVEGLLLNASEGFSDDFKAPIVALFRSIYQQAVAEAKESFGAFAEPEVWEQLRSPAQEKRAIDLVVKGYLHAQKRWPNIVAAQVQFKALEELASAGQAGERLVVQSVNGHLSMARHLPEPAPARARRPRP